MEIIEIIAAAIGLVTLGLTLLIRRDIERKQKDRVDDDLTLLSKIVYSDLLFKVGETTTLPCKPFIREMRHRFPFLKEYSAPIHDE